MYSEELLKLGKMLYPTGRAFRMPKDGMSEKLHEALAEAEAELYTDALGILNSILPDNDNFTADDATDWERRLGIAGSSTTSLADRKAAILRKYSRPGTIRPRQNYLYIQSQLQAAGFNVEVFENIWDDGMGGTIQKAPADIYTPINTIETQHAFNVQHGLTQHGSAYSGKIANHIEEEKDLYFSVGPDLRNLFYIAAPQVGGVWVGSPYVYLPLARKDEFRHLVLTLKPANQVAFLFVNYV